MIHTHGGPIGGYGLYLVKGKPVFTMTNSHGALPLGSPAALPPGKHTMVFDFTYDGAGFGKGGTGILRVDGKEVARKTMPHTIPFLISFDESFDVGVDTRTGVDDNDYQVPFRFTGKLDKLTVKLDPLNAAEEKLLQQKGPRHERQGTVKRSAADLIYDPGACPLLAQSGHPLVALHMSAFGGQSGHERCHRARERGEATGTK